MRGDDKRETEIGAAQALTGQAEHATFLPEEAELPGDEGRSAGEAVGDVVHQNLDLDPGARFQSRHGRPPCHSPHATRLTLEPSTQIKPLAFGTFLAVGLAPAADQIFFNIRARMAGQSGRIDWVFTDYLPQASIEASEYGQATLYLVPKRAYQNLVSPTCDPMNGKADHPLDAQARAAATSQLPR